VIYRCIDQLQPKASAVSALCRLLDVSRSGYYAARRRARRPAVACAVMTELQAAFTASGRSYGSRRLHRELRSQGLSVGRYRVRRLMRMNGIHPVWKRKFIHTTDSSHRLPIAANVLNRQFAPVGMNQSWVADITYIRTRSGWIYLAAVMDLFSRKIIGWAMAPSMPAELVCCALQMALTQRNPAPGLIVHSDRGIQYASDSYRALLNRYGCRASMSRKGNCWDNAVMERFFLNLKMERVWQREYANQAEAIRDVADYIVGFYNAVRLHSTLGYLPPNTYELKSAAKQPIHVSENT
jgi:transposase InsO family protein